MEKNEHIAAGFYKQAADQNDTKALFNLGMCFKDGVGVEQSDSNAVALLKRAAEQGHPKANFQLGVIYERGVRVGGRPNAKAALSHYSAAAESGSAVALNNLGVIFSGSSDGLALPRNDVLAVRYLKKAAEKGDAKASLNMATMISKGRGGPEKGSEKFLLAAAEAGNGEAARRLAEAHGKKEDWKQARKWYRMAAKAGSAQAWHELGKIYLQGEGCGVKRNTNVAARHLSKAVEGGVQEAHLLLGQTLLERGQRDLAAQHLRKAMAANVEGAKEELDKMALLPVA